MLLPWSGWSDPEDGDSMDLWNNTTTTLHGVTNQKTITWIYYCSCCSVLYILSIIRSGWILKWTFCTSQTDLVLLLLILCNGLFPLWRLSLKERFGNSNTTIAPKFIVLWETAYAECLTGIPCSWSNFCERKSSTDVRLRSTTELDMISRTNILKHYDYIWQAITLGPIIYYLPPFVLSIITTFLFFFRGGSVFPITCNALFNKVLINMYTRNHKKLWITLLNVF